jgi:hypothetical protein
VCDLETGITSLKRRDNERKAILSLRTEQDLIAAEPAGAGGICGDLEPFVILINNAEFRAVVDGEGSAGVFKRTAADGYVTAERDGSARGTVFAPREADASKEQNCGNRRGEKIKSKRALEVWTPFAESQNDEAEPERSGGEECPFVEGQFAEDALGVARGKGRALDLVASELEIRANVRIARSQSLSLTINCDGFANLAVFEIGVAKVEVERDGSLAGVEDVFVGGDRFREFAGVEELVSGLEGGGRVGRGESGVAQKGGNNRADEK